MFLKNKMLFSGISNEKGVELIQTYNINTGYTIQRITNGEILGSFYELKENESEMMFVETPIKEEDNTIFKKGNTIIAGVLNEIGFDLCLYKLKNNETLYTGKKFIRIHDGQEMGNVVHLGNDHSYTGDKVGRVDKPQYYIEVDDIFESNEEVVEGVEN